MHLPGTSPAMNFHAFQRDFAAHIRNPRKVARPAGVPPRRMQIYNELVINNLRGFLDTCFPVVRAVLGDRRWRQLSRNFLRNWPLHTPWFREISQEFVHYLSETAIATPSLPPWLPELAHYEWAELAVDIMETQDPEYDPAGDLMCSPIVLNPAMMSLAYHWPVHRIGTNYRPRKNHPVNLLVYRDGSDTVRFVEINPVTARLLELLRESPCTGNAACRRIAQEIPQSDPENVVAFGARLLAGFHQQDVVLGTLPANPK